MTIHNLAVLLSQFRISLLFHICFYLLLLELHTGFHRRQLRWSGISNCLRIFQRVVIHTVKGFGIVSEGEVDVQEFPWLSCDSTDVDNLISGSFAFSKSCLCSWKFLVHLLLKCRLEDLGHYFASTWNECNCAIVWTFFGIVLLWDWNETDATYCSILSINIFIKLFLGISWSCRMSQLLASFLFIMKNFTLPTVSKYCSFYCNFKIIKKKIFKKLWNIR